VERATPSPPLDLRLGFASSEKSLISGHRDEGVKEWIKFLNPLQARLREFDWRDRFGT
jgi:hypothetical protein